MTKEELKQEAEEYLEKNYCCKTVCTCNEIKECKEGIRIRCTAFNHRKQLIVDFAEPREKQIQTIGERCLQLQKDKGNLTDKVKELEAQIEKLIHFVLIKTDCCDVCPIKDTCINGEGTCPYASILSKDEEAVTRKWLIQNISKEIKEK